MSFLICFLLFEVSVKKSLKCTAVTSFVLSHFMYCIVNSIQIKFLSLCRKLFLTFACTVFCHHSQFKIFLC